jgi:dUTPase
MIIKIADFSARGIQVMRGGAPAPDVKEQVAYDLHIGSAYRIPGDANRHALPDSLFLKPNDCILFETEESLSIPADLFGLIVSRASLAAEGIVVANLKIDPRFYGPLAVTVINTGRRYLHVYKGMPFCSIFFQSLESSVDGHDPRTPPQPRILPSRRYKEKFLASLPFLLTFIASVVSSLVAAYIFIWVHGNVAP